jgi:hypothetical protein
MITDYLLLITYYSLLKKGCIKIDYLIELEFS